MNKYYVVKRETCTLVVDGCCCCRLDLRGFRVDTRNQFRSVVGKKNTQFIHSVFMVKNSTPWYMGYVYHKRDVSSSAFAKG